MILRVIRGRAARERVIPLRAVLDEHLGLRTGAGASEGDLPERYHLAIRASDPVDEVLILACWRSPEAVARKDAQNTSALALTRDSMADVGVEHFEVDTNVLRDPEATPTALRIATGRFSRPGGDIRMQDLLRERLPNVGPEMTEAYVGRRLAGRTVEVTFVSLWRSVPEGQRLEDAFWPDISVQYDEFNVEVYRPVD